MHRTLIPRSLRSRLLLTYLALTLLGTGGLILWTGLRLQAAVIEQAKDSLAREAFIIGNALQEPLMNLAEGDSPEGRSLESLVRASAQSTGTRVTVVDPELRVILSSDVQVPVHSLENRPELLAAQQGREQHDVRRDERSGEERLFVAVPATGEDGKDVGFIQLSAPMAQIYAEIRRTWLSLFATGGIVVIATALVSLVLARQIAGPVLNLTAVTEDIAAGHLEQRVTPAGPDEIQRLGRTFNRMAERVQEMLARQEAFVANAAHELRSPLTSIRLRLEMLQTHAQGNGELTQRYLSQMELELDHLRQVVDHLLDLSSLDEGVSPPRTPLDLSPLLAELAGEIRPLAQHAGLDLRVDIPPHLPPVVANAEQMRIVIRNLLDNAVKYTPAGGQITLAATPDDGVVRVTVADTGVGIPAEALPHIFERFYRVDRGRSRRQGGAGLGLALARAIVEAHGGQMDVRSRPGEGTVFTLRLPAGDP